LASLRAALLVSMLQQRQLQALALDLPVAPMLQQRQEWKQKCAVLSE